MNARLASLLLRVKGLIGPMAAKALELLLPLIKPAIKVGLIMVVKEQGPLLLAQLKEAIKKDGLDGLDRVIDRGQTRLTALSFLPASLDEKVDKAIMEYGDALQSTIRSAVSNGGLDAVDATFDTVQDELIAKIQAL